MDNPKLNEIRKEINAIDNQLLPLLCGGWMQPGR